MRVEAVLTLAVVASALAQPRLPHGHNQPHRPVPTLPVPDDFGGCRMQQMYRPHVSCSPDGSYTSAQCGGGRCQCVNPLTGIRLVGTHSVPEREKDTLNCAEKEIREKNCSPLMKICNNVCPSGYSQDKNGCPTCNCKLVDIIQPRCKTHAQLLEEGCPCGCIQTEGPGCPTCDPQCKATDENINCQVNKCAHNQVRLSTGKYGEVHCVDFHSPGDICGEVREVLGVKGWDGLVGALNRSILLGGGHRPCQENHICQQTTLKHRTCQPVDQNDPCREQSAASPRGSHVHLQCSDDGGFEPVQCRYREVQAPQQSKMSSTRECRCVNATNGRLIEGTGVTVGPRDREPDCQHKSYRHCDVPGLHGPHQHRHHQHRHNRLFRVQHGHRYFDTSKCRTCQCHDGNPHAFCTEARNNCTLLVPKNTFQNCSLPSGETLEHGAVMKLDCEVCGCHDGRLRCIQPHHCKHNAARNETDPCKECERKSTLGPVCGPDGRNHISSCAALHCAAVSPLDIRPGPCQSQDPCVEHPCKENEVCVRRGGVACVSRGGCKAHHLRTCFEKESLLCAIATNTSSSSTEEGEGTEVCGSDGQTHPSLCELLQMTTGVQVVHRGKCHAPTCHHGPVCGSDGVTYPNMCVLRSQSMARVDYHGECHLSQDPSLETHCHRVRTKKLCQHNSKNCPNLVQPQDGCCPVCGGAVTVALDQDALEEASEQDSELGTVDGFVSRLMESQPFQGLLGKCRLEATLTGPSNLQLTFNALLSTDAKHCQSISESFALSVNDATQFAVHVGTHHEASLTFPQVYEFAMAAFAEPTIMEDFISDNERDGAIQALPTAITCVILIVGAILTY